MTFKSQLSLIATALVLMLLQPEAAVAQAGIASEREAIVAVDPAILNTATPGYEWEGASLLQDIRVIDGLGNRPATGQDVLIADGKIQAIGRSGSLDVPADARIIDGDGLTVLPGLSRRSPRTRITCCLSGSETPSLASNVANVSPLWKRSSRT